MTNETVWQWIAWSANRERICDCGTARGETEEQARGMAWQCIGGPHMQSIVEIQVKPIRDAALEADRDGWRDLAGRAIERVRVHASAHDAEKLLLSAVTEERDRFALALTELGVLAMRWAPDDESRRMACALVESPRMVQVWTGGVMTFRSVEGKTRFTVTTDQTGRTRVTEDLE